MDSGRYVVDFNEHLSYLYAFAKKVNELDFAASLSGEFRGVQDPGWNTMITAHEVFEEINSLLHKKERLSKAEFRTALMLYCQLSEAGGVYETLKNMMGIITFKPYLLWPFKDLVRVKNEPRRVIGPNANTTFRDLATTAKAIGLARLSSLLEETFRDDIRNGISHTDYIIWEDRLRLRNRNGGFAAKLSMEDINAAFTRGVGFFQMLRDYNAASVRSFYPAKKIVGRLSANQPMSWTVSFDPKDETFQINGSSPGSVITAEVRRQDSINSYLGGRVLSNFVNAATALSREIEAYIFSQGFEPNNVFMDQSRLAALIIEIDGLGLWDERTSHATPGEVLLVSPWGFRWLYSSSDFDALLEEPLLDFSLE